MRTEWRRVLRTCMTGIHIEARVGRSRHGESTSRNRMGGNAHWESRRWKTKIVQQAVAEVLNQIYEGDSRRFLVWFPAGSAVRTMRWIRLRRESHDEERVNWIH